MHRVKESKYWHGLVSLPAGKRVFRSTGISAEGANEAQRMAAKAMALKVAMEWERVAKGTVGSSEQARRVLQDIVRLTAGDLATRLTCRQYGSRWIEAQRGTVADSTLDFYASAVNAWAEWLAHRADQPLDVIQREDMVAYRNAESMRVSSATANHRIKVVRQLLKAAAAEGFLGMNPAVGIKSLRRTRKEKKVRRPFSPAELQQVAAVMDVEWRLILWIGLYTGQRLGDVLRLRCDEVDVEKGTLQLEAGKTGTKMWIPIPVPVAEEIGEWCEGGGKVGSAAASPHQVYVFPAQVKVLEANKGKVGPASKRFAHYLWKAGLRGHSPFGSGQRERSKKKLKAEKLKAEMEGAGRNDRRAPQELSFHSLRHTARTLLEEAGQPRAVIDAFIGHEGDTGKIYTTVGETALRAAAAALAAAIMPRSSQ